MACLRRSSLFSFLFARSFRWFVNIVKLEKSATLYILREFRQYGGLLKIINRQLSGRKLLY